MKRLKRYFECVVNSFLFSMLAVTLHFMRHDFVAGFCAAWAVTCVLILRPLADVVNELDDQIEENR